MKARLLLLVLGAWCVLAAWSSDAAVSGEPQPAQEAAHAEKPPPRLLLDATPRALGGVLGAPALWQAYKARFVTDQGRVVDTGNGQISHSEGQGYGMLLAIAANDRETFDRIWGWTRANLMVRDDELVAWRWEPDKRPAVADVNNASDGDLLIAWALAEAADYWREPAYAVAGRRIAVEAARKVVLFKTKLGAILLPGVAGFHVEDRSDGPVVNLSYYIFPAFPRLALVAPEFDWIGLSETGLALLDRTRGFAGALPADWISLKDEKVTPAAGFAPAFSYNAVRVPLYMAWAGLGEREQYAPFMALVKRTRGALAMVDVATGKDLGPFGEDAIGAVGALVACVYESAKAPSVMLVSHAQENYYPATLHMLALVAMRTRYASCLPS